MQKYLKLLININYVKKTTFVRCRYNKKIERISIKGTSWHPMCSDLSRNSCNEFLHKLCLQ